MGELVKLIISEVMMGHKIKQSLVNSRVDFFYYAFRNVLLVSVPLLIVSGVVLSHLSFHSSATGSSSGVDQIQFSLSSSCTMSSVVNEAHTKEINNGTYHSDVGKTTITTLCNDGNGYSVYAAGYSNNEDGNTKLINAEHPEYSIDTGLNTSGLTSAWAMKLNNIPDDPSPTPPVIEPAYDNTYGLVPQYWTRVASRPSGTTDMDEGSSFTTTYAIYTTSNQHAGTYNGQVKYMLVHPNTNKPTLSNLESAFASHGIQPIYHNEDDKYYYAMQDMTTDICSSVSGDGETTATQLVDTRDNKLYWVTKLKDGHCWMTQNLDFDIEANTVLDSNTTDLNVAYNSSTGEYAEYNDGYAESNRVIYWKPASSATTINFQNNGPISGWQSSNTAPYTTNKTDSTETGHNSLGNYYNWTAAIASNNSSSLTQDTLSDISKNPQNSICPKGWRLPTISSESETLPGSTNEFARLNFLYNNNAANTDAGLTSMPLLLTRYGRISGGQIVNFNNTGYYTSSTIGGSGGIYYISFGSNSSSPTSYYSDTKVHGYALRCVAK